MRSTQIFAVLAVVAASVSGMSIGGRHASVATHDSVLRARGARQPSLADLAKRREARRVHKRRSNQRRCAATSDTSSSELPTSTPAVAVAVSTSTSSTPEPTTTSHAKATTTSKAKLKEAQTTTKESTTTKEAQTTTKTSTSAQATSTSTSSSSSGSNTGEGTFYATGLGACGIDNVDTDYICAVSQSLFDGFDGYTGGNPNNNPICGKKITATYQGKSVTVTVTDRCVGCAYYDLDFSPSAFDQLADESVGRLTGMTWKWV